MPKFKVPQHILELNKDIPELQTEEVSIPSKPVEDKKHLFYDAWVKYAPAGYDMIGEYRFDPSRKFRADFAFRKDKHRLLVEVDGGAWMVVNSKAVGRHNKDADLEKANLCAELGWRVMHFSPTMLTNDPVGCVESVIRALNYR